MLLHSTRRRRLPALLAAGVVAIAAIVRAGDVPPSAYSIGLGVEPSLLEDIDLVFDFPEWAVVADSAALEFGRRPAGGFLHGATDFDELAAGARFDVGSLAAFALSQRSYVPGSTFSTSPALSNVVQLGVAVGGAGRRAGAAVRGSRTRSEATEVVVGIGSERTNVRQDIVDYLAASAGAGFAAGDARIDFAIEATDVDIDVSGMRRSDSDTTTLRVRGTSDKVVAGSVHVGMPLGRRVRAVVSGRFQAGEIHWAGQRYNGGASVPVARSLSVESWIAGVTLAFAAPRVDAVLVSGSFERLRDANLRFDSFDGETRNIGREDLGKLGIALRKRLWPAFDARAGVVRTYSREWQGFERVASDFLNSSGQRVDRITDTFTWGAVYRWRGFWFTGAFNQSLTVSDPLAALDVHIEL
jgi:hypothetical protein